MGNEFAIEIKNLEKSFKNVKVLEGINLSVKRGTMLALLGPNGAGKTTTIRILSTLLSPDAGEVYINGINAIENPSDIRAQIGLTGQYAAVDEYLSAEENLIMMGRLYHLSKADAKLRANDLIKEFDLIEAKNRIVKTYSGGMRRRLDLAVSLIATPPILFLDEPTTGLDPRSRIVIWDIVKKLLKQGITILLTTQYLDEADKLADKIAVLHKGTIIANGTADELKAMVGKERLEITIEKESDFNKAVDAITGENKEINIEERKISIATNGTVLDLKRTLDAMTTAGVEVETFFLHKPTLDDVFLTLTGSTAEDK